MHLIDFESMTGHTHNAKPIPEMLVQKPKPKDHDSRTHEDEPYNFLDYEEKPTRTRSASNSKPRPPVVDDDTTGTYGVHRKVPRSNMSSRVPDRAARALVRKRRPGAGPLKIDEEDSGSDSDAPLIAENPIKKRRKSTPAPVSSKYTVPTANMHTPSAIRKHRPTPASTQTPSVPSTCRPSVAPSDADRTRTTSEFPIEIEDSPAKVKTEPLSGDALTKTILFVTASNKTKAPLTVPLNSCRTSVQLFATLITELRIPSNVARNVEEISVTYTWGERALLIRKNNSDHWSRFCNTIRKAWESSAYRFNDKCEVEMVVHVE